MTDFRVPVIVIASILTGLTGAAAAPSQAPRAQGAGAARGQTATGTVVETVDAAGYTYVQVDTGREKIWAAATQFSVKVGERVVVPLDMPMANFESKTLKRTFPLVYFAQQIVRAGQATGPSAPAPMSSHPPASAASAAAAPVGKVAPAPGGLSVADVWAKRKTLAGKAATVRGKVVKYNGGIMGVNWLHLQDGSGDEASHTNDLTVTTDADAKVGDVVTITGTVAIDKDFGAGYAYGVIVEKATLRTQ